MSADPLLKLTWQGENCLSCKWMRPSAPINADLLARGKCVHPKLKPFNLIISGRDWCNVFEPITKKQVDAMQDKAMKAEDEAKAEKKGR